MAIGWIVWLHTDPIFTLRDKTREYEPRETTESPRDWRLWIRNEVTGEKMGEQGFGNIKKPFAYRTTSGARVTDRQ